MPAPRRSAAPRWLARATPVKRGVAPDARPSTPIRSGCSTSFRPFGLPAALPPPIRLVWQDGLALLLAERHGRRARARSRPAALGRKGHAGRPDRDQILLPAPAHAGRLRKPPRRGAKPQNDAACCPGLSLAMQCRSVRLKKPCVRAPPNDPRRSRGQRCGAESAEARGRPFPDHHRPGEPGGGEERTARDGCRRARAHDRWAAAVRDFAGWMGEPRSAHANDGQELLAMSFS